MLKYIMAYLLYCVGSDYTDKHGVKKLGMTTDPVKRLHSYNTGDAPGIGLDKRYDGLWQVIAESKEELIQYERRLHAHFHWARKKRDNQNYTEWFTVSYQEVRAYLNSQAFVLREVPIEEIEVIHRQAVNNEMNQIRSTPSLRDEFFNTFLEKDWTPRRIQLELWERFESVCLTQESYKGIVQWPTGVGKTIATLMMIVLCAHHCEKKGDVFRCLLVSPKNDIVDTIQHHFRKLRLWDIQLCIGAKGKLSTMHIPNDKHVVIITTHSSLTKSHNWEKLPDIAMFHYDEVHRITGDEFYTSLKTHLRKWNTCFVTGTSATPKTCCLSQNKKLADLFGDPLPLLHTCSVHEAVDEQWIAQPRFGVHIIGKMACKEDQLCGFVRMIRVSVQQKKEQCKWQGGKVIAYTTTREEVRAVVELCKRMLPTAIIYSAVEKTNARSSDAFISDAADGTTRCLIACDRFREGSDIKGVEMTCIFMGDTTAANVLLQVAGRALRYDYKDKEGWCMLFKRVEDGMTEDDVLNSVIVSVMEFIGKDTSVIPDREKTKEMAIRFLGPVSISGKVYNLEETVDRIQAMFLRKAYNHIAPKEKYTVVRNLNREMGLTTKNEYQAHKDKHVKYIEDPQVYFKDAWVSWSHFLGVDTTMFPPTKDDWIQACKKRGLTTWEDYKTKRGVDLPENPGELYNDYTNWEIEFRRNTEDDDHVW
jgi:superfamily II DNA or RNA helicase